MPNDARPTHAGGITSVVETDVAVVEVMVRSGQVPVPASPSGSWTGNWATIRSPTATRPTGEPAGSGKVCPSALVVGSEVNLGMNPSKVTITDSATPSPIPVTMEQSWMPLAM